MLSTSIFRQFCLKNCKETSDRLSWWKSFWRLDIMNAVNVYYDRIDISEEIDPTKSNKSRECMLCP